MACRNRLDRVLESATQRQKRVMAAAAAGAAQVLFLALLLFGLHTHVFAQSAEIEMTLGGPIGTRLDPARLPEFMRPQLPTVLPPIVETRQTFQANLAEPQGAPDTTTPAEAISQDHVFPVLPGTYKSAGAKLVRLTLSITADGTIADASVAESSGIGDLDELAVAWVKSHWRYHPAMQNGIAIAVTTTAIVVFSAA